MSENQERARQTTFLVVGKVLSSLSEAAVPMVLVRMLPATEVGILSAMLMIYAILAPILTANFPATLMFYLPTREAPVRRAIAGRVALVLFGLGAAAGALLFSLGMFALLAPDILRALTNNVVGGTSAVGPDGLKYLALLALMPLGDIPARMLPNLLVVEGRARTAAGIGVVKSIGTAAFLVVPIALGMDIWFVVASIALFGFAYGALVLYYLHKLYPGNKRQAVPFTTGELFRFAIPLGLTDVTSTLNAKMDQFLITLYFVAAMVAQYQMGAFRIPVVTAIAMSTGAIYTPHFTRLFAANKPLEAIETWRLSIRKVSMLVVPIALVFFVAAEETIELLFTKEYLGASNVFRAYCLLSMGRVAAFGPVLVAAGRPKLVFQAATLTLVANVVISVPLLFIVGFEGPAIGTALAFIPSVVAYCWCISRASGVPLRKTFPLTNYLKVVAVGAVAAGAAVVVKISLPFGPVLRLTAITVVVVVVFVAVGAATRLIRREDWLFVGQWFSEKLRRESGEER